jgi:serine protease inhibitor
MQPTLRVVLLVGISLSLIASGCSRNLFDNIFGSSSSGDGSTPGPDPKLAKVAVDPRLLDANERFAINLFKQLAGSANSNLFISPASVSLALYMTINGASGTARDQMAQTLAIQGISLEDLNSAGKILLSNLVYGDDKVTLKIANSLWGRYDVPFEPAFLSRNWKSYAAKITAMDFSAPDALATINGWIADNTGGRIVDMLDEIPGNVVLYLINAIYFKADWSLPFADNMTMPSNFTAPDGSDRPVELMHQTESFPYLETDDFQAVSLPYGDEGRFSMYLFLPSKALGVPGFVSALTPETWSTWMDSFTAKEGTVILPKLSMRWRKLLNDDLKAMGMIAPFSSSKDFAPMTLDDRELWISRVIHETFLGMDEDGTEATGATIVEMREKSFAPEFEIRLDRPFITAIRDNVTGTILFMGIIADPVIASSQ